MASKLVPLAWRNLTSVIGQGKIIVTVLMLLCITADAIDDLDEVRKVLSSITQTNGNSFCNDPGPIKHGYRQPEPKLGTIFASGTTIHFSCSSGYKLVQGVGKMVCAADGEWQPPNKPRCRPVLCLRPSIPHGHVLITGVEFPAKTSLEVQCNTGFRLRNKYVNSLECRTDGSWTGHNGAFTLEFPECVESTCSPLPNVANAALVYTGLRGWDSGFKEGSVAVYHCHDRFRMSDDGSSGAETIRCVNGTWNGNTKFTCDLTGCNPPPTIMHGDVRILDDRSQASLVTPEVTYPVGVSVVYWCDAGYALMGSPSAIRCTADGHWSLRQVPTCQKISGSNDEVLMECPPPPTVMYGYVADIVRRSGQFSALATVTYECHSGFNLVGSRQLTCASEGVWTPEEPPSCEINMDKKNILGWDSVEKTTSPPPSSFDSLGTQTITFLTAGCVVGLLFLVLVVSIIGQRRKYGGSLMGGRLRPERLDGTSGPTDPPLCRDQDRVALLAFADRIQASGLPSYEESISHCRPPPFEVVSTSSAYRQPSHMSSRYSRHGGQQQQHSTGCCGVGTRHSSTSTSHSACGRSSSLADSLASTDTVTPSEVSTTVTVDTLSSTTSQATSCSTRPFCGSLASFDTTGSGSVANIEGVPLLEEPESGAITSPVNTEDGSDFQQMSRELPV